MFGTLTRAKGAPPPYTKSFVRPFMFDDYAFTKVLAHFNDKEIEIEETVSVNSLQFQFYNLTKPLKGSSGQV